MNINRNFILSVFENINIKDDYKQLFVTDYALAMFQTAFIAKSVNPQQNYEVLEFLGDSASNHAAVAYFYNTYPQLQCLSGSGVATLSRLKIKYRLQTNRKVGTRSYKRNSGVTYAGFCYAENFEWKIYNLIFSVINAGFLSIGSRSPPSGDGIPFKC